MLPNAHIDQIRKAIEGIEASAVFKLCALGFSVVVGVDVGPDGKAAVVLVDDGTLHAVKEFWYPKEKPAED